MDEAAAYMERIARVCKYLLAAAAMTENTIDPFMAGMATGTRNAVKEILGETSHGQS